MTFTPAELDYLARMRLGRLATAQPDGTLQVSPVGFHHNTELGTIDIVGHTMSSSRKYRNVEANGRAAFVVDDVPSVDPWRVRCLEIRGRAEAVPAEAPGPHGTDGALIRVHPERVISFGIDGPDREAHDLVANNRDVRVGPVGGRD